jgi:outer membrane protein OmpA-like peptidoglycan-associated protein
VRHLAIAAVLVLSIAISGCTGRGQSSSTTSPSPEASVPTAAATVAPSTAPAADTTSGPQATPTPVSVPTPTPDPNLLSIANGTILRSYSPVALDRMGDGNLGNAARTIGSELPDDAKPPFVFTFELPGVATIAEFQAGLRGTPDKGPVPSVTFAVSTTGADSGFADVGTVTRDAAGGVKTLPAGKQARWVRVTANLLFDSVGATGTIAAPAAPIDPTGFYIEEARPEKNGAFVMSGTREGDSRARFVAVGSAVTATECTKNTVYGTFIGQFQGRSWTAAFAGNKDENPSKIREVINDDASIIAGTDAGGSPMVFMRTSEKAAFCVPRVLGTGTHHVLVLDQDPIEPFDPTSATTPLPGYTFESIGAGMLDAAALSGKETVISRNVCQVPELMAPEQRALLLQWVAAGHKLVLGGGACADRSDFSWLPYPFAAKQGPETHNASLIQVENNALGTNDKNDAAHYVDVASYVRDTNNALASAVAVTTADQHWCGHFFVAKPTNLDGFVQMYAVDGRGLLIYDGFNPTDDGRPGLQRIRQLELAQPVPADLPCSQQATESFILEPNQEATFAAGSAQTVGAKMQVLANQGWSGHASVKTTGDLRATVSPSAFDIAGGTQVLDVSVKIPASQKPGVYTVNVIADNGSGKTAQASVSLTGTASLKKQFKANKTQKRIRIYGIHFDVDSAHIQPRSEPVIADIAQIMRETPGLRFQVEGHTDSDGGAPYNLGLSQRRAQAVVDDLVARHKIARARLVAKGYGLSKPVASNATASGKALNRRVELLRL